MSAPFDPRALNLTELVAICKEVVPQAHRGLPRELLEAIALGEQAELPVRRIDKVRLRIMQYIDENYDQVEYQLSCPAKSRDPYACFTCSDLLVASCMLENKKISQDEEERSEPMAQTVKVKTANGEEELQVLSVEEIDTLLNDQNPQSRTKIMDHMKALGRPVTELIRMKVPERKAYILERYAELGVGSANGKAKGKTTGGTVTQLSAAKPAQTTARKAATKSVESEPEDDEGSVPAAAGIDSKALESLEVLIHAQRTELTELRALVESQGEALERSIAMLQEQKALLLDLHFIQRVCAPVSAGLTEDDVIEVGNANAYYGKLLVGEVEDPEGATGND